MNTAYIKWEGSEWQRHITTLLSIRYRLGSFQPIPDRVKGDYGLEGFATDGLAFQAYAAEEPLAVGDLTDNQRDKITKDIKKFCDNHTALSRIFGEIKINTWILLVPRYEDKRILEHAEKKAQEVRSKCLPIVTSDFRISVQDDSVFGPEKQSLRAEAFARLKLQTNPPGDEAIAVWESANTSLVETLDRKLKRLTLPLKKHQELRAQMIKHFLEGQNALHFLHSHYPSVAERVVECKGSKERLLAMESLLSSALPKDLLVRTVEDYKYKLTQEVAGVGPSTAALLAYEATADWLLRCPLDFAE